MAVTYRASNFSFVIDFDPSGIFVATEVPGAASGDALVAIFYATGSVGQDPLGLPSGWTPFTGMIGTQGAFTYNAGYIIRGGSAPSLDFTYVDPPGGDNNLKAVAMYAFQTSGGTITLDSQSASGSSGNGAVAPNCPSTTAVASSSLAFCFSISYSGETFTAPAGYDLHVESEVIAATKSLASAGVEDPAAFGGSPAAADYWHGGTITLTDVGARRWFLGAH